MPPSQRHDGAIALVTGAGTGLGRAVALRLASEGAVVIVNHPPGAGASEAANRVVGEIQSLAGKAHAAEADVTDTAAVAEMTDAIVHDHGPPQILVANAALAVTEQAPWREFTAEHWRRIMDVNVLGAVNCISAAYDALASSGRGSIVLMSSVTPLLGRTGNLPYVTSKAALIGMTRSLAREVGPDGVRVNAIAPGAIQTASESAYGSEQDLADQLLPLQSIKRRGLPDDVAGAVSFLASSDAAFITGQLVVVDGGWVMP